MLRWCSLSCSILPIPFGCQKLGWYRPLSFTFGCAVVQVVEAPEEFLSVVAVASQHGDCEVILVCFRSAWVHGSLERLRFSTRSIEKFACVVTTSRTTQASRSTRTGYSSCRILLFHFEQCLEQRPRVAALRRVLRRTRNFARSRICPSRCGQEAVDTCISLAHRAVVITSVHPVSGTNVVASALDELALRCVRLNARSCWTELRWHLHVVFIRRPLEARRSTLRQLAHSGRSWLLLDVHRSQDVCSGSTSGTR